MTSIEFTHPLALLLLPLALLPLLRRRRDALPFPWLGLLPVDPLGSVLQRLWQALAMLTLAAIVLGLSAPGIKAAQIELIGRGAEIAILLDRSSSMDAAIRVHQRTVGESSAALQSKNDVARQALTWLLQQRPKNRFSLTLFNVAPIRGAPFTDDIAMVQAGLDASDVGRGPSDTKMGLGILAAIEGFEGRSYSGSRAILLVSDGGARLDKPIRERIKQGLARHRIALYFIYIRSSKNSPNLELVGTDVDARVEEVALHVFFAGLDSEYRVFQAEDPDSMARAVAQIDQLQNLPLIYRQRVPRIDYSRYCFAAALGCGLMLAGLGAVRLERLA